MTGVIYGPKAARQIRDAVRKSKRLPITQSGGRPTTVSGAGRLVVKTTEDMPGDDPEFYECTVMSLVDGVWEETDSTVQVRNISADDIPTDTRILVAQVSNLGYCVE